MTVDVELTEEQLAAGRTLLDRVEAGFATSSLAGAAGCGKTTLLRWISDGLVGAGWRVIYGAPTGKAASRLQSVIGAEVSTLHALTYQRVSESRDGAPVFLDPRDKFSEGARTILLADEASMVSVGLAADLERATGEEFRVIYAGDHCQLLPVASSPGVDLSRADATLTTVHRQALENPLLAVATAVRNGGVLPRGRVGETYERREGSVLLAASWLAERFQEGADAVAICLTNDVRKKINGAVRRILGRESEALSPGDQIVVFLNNKLAGVYNGETMVVRRVAPFPGRLGEVGLCDLETDRGKFIVHLPSMGADLKEFKRVRDKVASAGVPAWPMIHVDLGYALTVWKVQGSEFREVCLVLDGSSKYRLRQQEKEGRGGADESRRIAYTAITRAKHSALVIDT